MYEISNDIPKSVITFRASGVIRLDEMRTAVGLYTKATDSYKNRGHFLLADMRGMSALAPQVAAVMGEAIGYGRGHGVALCAHLSDSGIVRLQSGRLAREVSPNDKGTVDVVSVEEAWRVFEERRPMLTAAR